MDFVHLHVHSEYSLLDGVNRIKDLPIKAKELGMKAIALTDHGVMYGAIDFFNECKKNGIKPIIGCELYVAERSRFDKDSNLDKNRYHLTVLVKNDIGYSNLTKMLSFANEEGYYYKPRVDKELLEKYHEGLVVLSGCMAGEISRNILNDYNKAKEIATWYKNIFKDDYYLEIQSLGIDVQEDLNREIVKLAKEIGVNLVATNDVHYPTKEDYEVQDILICIQTGKKLSDTDRMKMETNEMYMRSPKEMFERFSYIPEALENTVKIADKCNFEFEFGNTKYPNYISETGQSNEELFDKLCIEGAEKRFGLKYTELDKVIIDRINYEKNIIKQMGYIDYFLIVWDFIHYAKTHNIPVGPGRGSGAGSIIAYLLEITDVDPIKYGLLFERFLNPERISMPDFDVDFCNEKREDVLKYVHRKYGDDHVAQIITFGTMSARMAIRDVARVLNIPFERAVSISKLVPSAPKMTIDKAMEMNKEFQQIYENDGEAKKIIDIAKKIEGMPRNISTHACGVVITKDVTRNYVPLCLNDGNIITQYTMVGLESLGMLKMDFLGLRTLSVIAECEKIVKKVRNLSVDYGTNYDDKEVYDLWKKGDTLGIFQFESEGIIKVMKELATDSIEDIIAGVSLYRPGPMDQIPRYIRGKEDKNNIEYTHKSLKDILNVTNGCMVYQEQVMEIFRKLAGYSLGRADIVRRAMGKKKIDVMEKERNIFINGLVENDKEVVRGCVKNGIDKDSANRIFDEMAEFAKYAFNKSHAAAYAILAYKTAYLKKYYTEELLAATMNSYIGNLEKIPQYIEDAKKHGIGILKPDVNYSYTKFSVDNSIVNDFNTNKNIRFGLGSIKNVGIGVCDQIIEERKKNGKYKNFINFLNRTKDFGINKKMIETLILVGAFDSMNIKRSSLLAIYEQELGTLNNSKRVDPNQVSFFEIFDETNDNDFEYREYPDLPEMDDGLKLKYEKELLGIYVSGHPLDKYRNLIIKNSTINTSNIKEIIEKEMKVDNGKEYLISGIVQKIIKKISKKGNIFYILKLEDLYGIVDIVVFDPEVVTKMSNVYEDTIIRVKGRLEIKYEGATITATDIAIAQKKQ